MTSRDSAADLQLDEYSRRFAERFFARFPEWRRHATIDPDHDARLHVAVEAPSGVELRVRTYGDQITLDFGPHWHEHFGRWTSANEQEVFDKAVQRIDDIVKERIVIVSRFVLGRHAWSRALPIREAPRAQLARRLVTSWSGNTLPPLSGI